jgi:hypothetical protein
MINRVNLDLPSIDLSGYDQKWTWGKDLQLLAHLGGLRKSSGSIVEIGCNEGRTTKFLAEQFPERTIVGVDWTGEPTMHPGEMPCRVNTQQIGRLVEGFANVVIHNQISWLFDYSAYAPFNLVFIDGDHQYESVKKDTEHACLMIQAAKEPAYIAWHDAVSSDEWCGVSKYLTELKWNIFLPNGSKTAFALIH